jgi:diguanylate cyclase
MNGTGEIHGHYNVGLVALSVAIAVVAAYASLDQARRASQTDGWKRLLWLASGGLTMGVGIWSMHFVGMLSFVMPVAVTYQPTLVALSLVAAVGGASISLGVVTRPQVARGGLLFGGAFMGVAVASMHYLGMDSMRMAAVIHWNVLLVVLSVLIGFASSVFALWLVVRISAEARGLSFGYHLLAAVLLGLGVSGLHYVGMAASTFYAVDRAMTASSFSTTSLITVLGCGGGLAFLALLGVLVVDQRRAELAIDLALVAGLSRELGRGSDVRTGACDAARRLMAADHVALLELDDGVLRVSASCGENLETASLMADSDHALSILRSAQRTFVSGSPDGEPGNGPRRSETSGSALYEPLILDGRPTGLLAVYWNRRVRRLSERTATLLGMLAVDAAVAMDRHDLMDRLEHLARRDDLTDLANRRVLSEELERTLAAALRSRRPVSAIMLDFDHFKRYNDSRGHQAGDLLLVSAAAAWRKLVRVTDTLARYGGDEFAVVLPDCTQERAVAMADRLRKAVPADASCSAGVATWDFMEPPDGLLDRADQALYRAKQGGRRQTGFVAVADHPTG